MDLPTVLGLVPELVSEQGVLTISFMSFILKANPLVKAAMESPAAINEATFDALASWFTDQPNALAQCCKPGYEFPTTEELESRVPKTAPGKPIKVGRQSNDEPLQMAFVPAKKVLAEAGLMILQVWRSNTLPNLHLHRFE